MHQAWLISWGCCRREHPGGAKVVAGGLTRLAQVVLALQGDRVTLHVELLGFCLLKDAKTQSKALKLEQVEMRKH